MNLSMNVCTLLHSTYAQSIAIMLDIILCMLFFFPSFLGEISSLLLLVCAYIFEKNMFLMFMNLCWQGSHEKGKQKQQFVNMYFYTILYIKPGVNCVYSTEFQILMIKLLNTLLYAQRQYKFLQFSYPHSHIMLNTYKCN